MRWQAPPDALWRTKRKRAALYRLCPLWHGTAPLPRVFGCALYVPYSPPYVSRAPRGLKNGLRNRQFSLRRNHLYLPGKMCFLQSAVCNGLRKADREKPCTATLFKLRSVNAVFLFAHMRAYTCVCLCACEELFLICWSFLQTTKKKYKKVFSFKWLNTEENTDRLQSDTDRKQGACHE